jgi:hypothetical protein
MTVMTTKQIPFAMNTMLATDLVPEPQGTTQPSLVQLPFAIGVTAGSHPALLKADWKRTWEYEPGQLRCRPAFVSD